MRVSLLGPVLAQIGETAVDLGGTKQRAVFAMLALSAGKIVAMDRLIDDLWHEEPPARATVTLRSYVTRLRRALEAAARAGGEAPEISTQPPGWVLRISPADVDLIDFHERLARVRVLLAPSGREATTDELRSGRDQLVAALGLWRGEALADLRVLEVASAEAARTDDARLTAVEMLQETRLQLGEHERVVDETHVFIGENPFRERAWAARVLALYRSGRQSDALAAVSELRRLLLDDLGMDPSPQIQDLEYRVLRQDPSLLPGRSVLTTPVPRASAVPAAASAGPVPTLPDAADSHAMIVGRDGSLKLLQEVAEASRRGRGRLLVLESEAGVGKTTMLQALEQTVVAGGGRVVHGGGGGAGAMPALWSWVTVVRALAPSSSPVGGGTTAIETARALMGVPTSEDSAAGQDVTLSRTALYRGVIELVAAAHRTAPLTVVFDDLQWVDDETLTLLSLAVDELAPQGVVFAVAVRTDEPAAQPVLAALWRTPRPLLERHRLVGLDEHSVGELARTTTGTPIPARVVRALHDATAGNPLFVTELVRLLAAERRLDVTGAATTLPDRVHDVLRRRIERLPDASVSLMRIAALARSAVDVEMLASVTGLDPDDVMDAVEPAYISGLLVERPDGAGFAPSHDLVRRALLLELSNARLVRLHARLAAALQSRGRQDPEGVLEVAHHLAAAAPAIGPAAAIPYLLSASEDAISRYATSTAADILEEALSLAQQLTDPAARAQSEQQVRGRLALVRAYGGTNDIPPYAQPTPPPPVDESSLPSWVGTVTLRAAGGEFRWARDVAVAAVRAGLPPQGEVAAQLALGWTAFALGDFDQAEPALARVLVLTDNEPLPSTIGLLTASRPSAEGYLALIAHIRGDDKGASATIERARRLSGANEVAEVNLELYACLLAAMRGDAGDALAHSARMIDLGRRLEYPVFVLHGRICSAWAAAMLGRRRDPSDLAAALAAYRSSGLVIFEPTYDVLLAEVHDHVGDHRAATQAITRSRTLSRDTGEVIHGPRLQSRAQRMTPAHP